MICPPPMLVLLRPHDWLSTSPELHASATTAQGQTQEDASLTTSHRGSPSNVLRFVNDQIEAFAFACGSSYCVHLSHLTSQAYILSNPASVLISDLYPVQFVHLSPYQPFDNQFFLQIFSMANIYQPKPLRQDAIIHAILLTNISNHCRDIQLPLQPTPKSCFLTYHSYHFSHQHP